MKIMVDGQLVEYSDSGTGRVVILLHGWGATHATFNELVDHLNQKFRIISLDFPGFGGSPKPDDSWDVGDYAKLVKGLVAKLQLKDIHALVGHSFGGRIIIKGVANGGLQSEKIVLIGTAGVKSTNSLKKAIYKSIAKVGKAATALPGMRLLRPALRKKLYGAAGATDYLNANDMKKIFINTINEDLLPIVHNIKQPTLLIWGENDNETPLDDARLIKQELPDGQLWVVPGAGHFVYVDNPQEVFKQLDAFL